MARLTIGLPVYNGAPLLARSLDKLLAQTFGDFVLILNDNASTDATSEICADYARRDSRVRYFRNPENICWNENFRVTLERADTPYFMWATHDDIWYPHFAEANIGALEANPEAICSVPKVIYFWPDGKRELMLDTGPLRGTPAGRLKRFLLTISYCARLYGLYRTDVLKASLLPNMHIYASDWLIVALTLLHGDHVEVDEILLEREGPSPDHYHKAFGRIDRFTPTWRDWLLPMRGFNAELRQHVPPQLWREIRPAVAYLSLRKTIPMWEYNFPPLRIATSLLRGTTATLFHRRWQKQEK